MKVAAPVTAADPIYTSYFFQLQLLQGVVMKIVFTAALLVAMALPTSATLQCGSGQGLVGAVEPFSSTGPYLPTSQSDRDL